MAFGDNWKAFWAKNKANRQADMAEGWDRWTYQPGETDKPWWMTDAGYQRRNAQYNLNKNLSDYQKNASTWMASMSSAWGAGLASLKGWYEGNVPTYTPLQWSDFQGRYDNYQNSLDSLLSRISAGPTTDDENAAFEQMARLYGMTPEQFRAMQTAAYGTTAEDINSRAETMAFDPNSEANQQFEAMIRSQQRAAEAGMGKQLETIFADRGGLGGFAAAQDFTLQMSDQMLQQRSQFMLDRMQQSVEMINQDLNRKLAIVQSGQADARQFLNDRWANLQQAFQDTSAMANSVLQEYALRSDVNQGDFQANLAAFTAQFNAQKDLLLTQMGIDQAAMDYMSEWYTMNVQPWLDQLLLDL